jgi:Cu/Ag efflux protein CusF
MDKTLPFLGLATTLAALLGFAPPAQAQSNAAEVVKVDKAQHKLTLRHDAIKSLGLPAMTMAYRVQDPRWLDPLQPGAAVKFDAAKIDGQYTVTRLTVEPAR